MTRERAHREAFEHTPMPLPPQRTLISLLCSQRREGALRVPGQLKVFAVMGRLVLDLRHAQLQPGPTPTVIRCVNVLGAVHILLPEGVYTELEGNVRRPDEGHSRRSRPPSGNEPWLRIIGAGGAIKVS